jgi:hypothetical protein
MTARSSYYSAVADRLRTARDETVIEEHRRNARRLGTLSKRVAWLQIGVVTLSLLLAISLFCQSP